MIIACIGSKANHPFAEIRSKFAESVSAWGGVPCVGVGVELALPKKEKRSRLHHTQQTHSSSLLFFSLVLFLHAFLDAIVLKLARIFAIVKKVIVWRSSILALSYSKLNNDLELGSSYSRRTAFLRCTADNYGNLFMPL